MRCCCEQFRGLIEALATDLVPLLPAFGLAPPLPAFGLVRPAATNSYILLLLLLCYIFVIIVFIYSAIFSREPPRPPDSKVPEVIHDASPKGN